VPLAGGWSSGLGSLYGAASDGEGRFRLALPSWADGAALRVSAPGYALRWVRLERLSVQEVVLPVAMDGGTLRLRSAPAEGDGELLPGAMIWSPDGEPQSAQGLQEWARVNGGGEAAGVLVVPQLAPGAYTACWFATLEEEAEALARGLRPGNRCASGHLPPQGELELRQPGL
jgi:hypothetical protein